jgi:hypothetical protein
MCASHFHQSNTERDLFVSSTKTSAAIRRNPPESVFPFLVTAQELFPSLHSEVVKESNPGHAAHNL